LIEVWLGLICSVVLTVPLLNVENGMKFSASDDGLHPKVQPNLTRCWHAVEQGVWNYRIGTCCSNESGVQDLMQSPGQSVEGFWLDVGSNPHQSCTHSAVYQVFNPWRGHSGLSGIQAVTQAQVNSEMYLLGFFECDSFFYICKSMVAMPGSWPWGLSHHSEVTFEPHTAVLFRHACADTKSILRCV